ncbi:tRNA (adenosine(37)-N6)-dimethylallyltransferase MiaA [Marisediminicola sp. LYQ134]|uniref:tRNA (adenosine(37)-N6)-dimethylallyltransferase MiaA n=1 Tax=Marisediminicola sp. LYQ134 TaxID=3391061 RepID=UPI003983A949
MLVAIVGATGTGKSDLALDVVERLAARGRRAEIVNADAMQLYRGMDIGTAKLPVADRRGVPHHLLDVLDVTDEATVARYQSEARSVIRRLEGRGDVAVLVGGSGLYVSSVLYDFEFPGTDARIREALEAELVERGPGLLHARLAVVDPPAAAAIGASNGRRLVRALEVIEMTGKPFGSGLPDPSAFWTDTRVVAVTAERATLVERLDERVHSMWRRGLVSEVEGLLENGLDRGVTARRAIGYAQAAEQIRGTLTREAAIDQTQALTRKYARRQVGWFRRYPATVTVVGGEPAVGETVVDALVSSGLSSMDR